MRRNDKDDEREGGKENAGDDQHNGASTASEEVNTRLNISAIISK